jgi:hypothetical protein
MPAGNGARIRGPHRYFWILLSAIALFGLAQAAATLGWSLRTDEPFTANTVHLDWPEMWERFLHDNIFPLHYLLLWGWVRLFRESEISLRIPSLLFFGLTILVVGRTAQRAARSRAGLMAALLLALSTNMGQVHAASARPYALLGLVVALATHATLVVLPLFAPPPAHPRRWHALLILLHTLGLLTHPLYVFVLAALTLAALWVSWRAALILALDGAVAAALFLLTDGPFLFQTMNLPTTAWMSVPDLKDLADGFLNLWGEQKTLLVGGYLLALGAWRGRKTWAALTQPLTLVVLTLLAFTSLAPFAISQFKPVYIDTRAPIIFLPGACVLAAILIRQLDQRYLSAGVMLILSAAAALSAYRLWAGPERVPARASVQYIAEHAQCGDALVLGSLSLSETEYYFRRFNAPACLHLETFPLDTAIHPGWLDGPGRLAQPDALRDEAAQTAMRLAAAPGRIWLFYDSRFYPEIGDVIKNEFDTHLTLNETLDLRGSFFDSILIYAP